MVLAACFMDSMVFGPWYCNGVTLDVIEYIGSNNKKKIISRDPDLCHG